MWDRIKGWFTSQLIQKYAGSWIRGLMRILAGYLLSSGLADADTANQFSGSLGDILVKLIDLLTTNPEVLLATISGGLAQWWSIKEKKGKTEE